jgi:hypothetical protein
MLKVSLPQPPDLWRELEFRKEAVDLLPIERSNVHEGGLRTSAG